MIAKPPVYCNPGELWHWSVDARSLLQNGWDASRSSGSLYGNGIAVSNFPEAWMEIAQLGGCDLVQVILPAGAKVLDLYQTFNTIEPSDIPELVEWAVKNGKAEKRSAHRLDYEDTDEDGESVEKYQLFENLTEAQNEAREFANSEITPSEILVPIGQGFNRNFGQDQNLLRAYVAAAHPEVAVVWYDDVLDVGNFSAPQGYVVPGWEKRIRFQPVTTGKKPNRRQAAIADNIQGKRETLQKLPTNRWDGILFHATPLDGAIQIVQNGFQAQHHQELGQGFLCLSQNDNIFRFFCDGEPMTGFCFHVHFDKVIALDDFHYALAAWESGGGWWENLAEKDPDAVKRATELGYMTQWDHLGMDDGELAEILPPDIDGVTTGGFDDHHPSAEAEIAVTQHGCNKLGAAIEYVYIWGEEFEPIEGIALLRRMGELAKTMSLTEAYNTVMGKQSKPNTFAKTAMKRLWSLRFVDMETGREKVVTVNYDHQTEMENLINKARRIHRLPNWKWDYLDKWVG